VKGERQEEEEEEEERWTAANYNIAMNPKMNRIQTAAGIDMR